MKTAPVPFTARRDHCAPLLLASPHSSLRVIVKFFSPLPSRSIAKDELFKFRIDLGITIMPVIEHILLIALWHQTKWAQLYLYGIESLTFGK